MLQETVNKCAVLEGKAYGFPVSEEGLKNNRLDYACMSRIVADYGGVILNNEMIYHSPDCWEHVNGDFYDEETEEYTEVYQWYIIDDGGATWLQEHTSEIVMYSEVYEMYLWGITHYGTSWDYVLSDVTLIPWEEYFNIH